MGGGDNQIESGAMPGGVEELVAHCPGDTTEVGAAPQTSCTRQTMSTMPFRGTAAHRIVICGSASWNPPLEKALNGLRLVKIS